MFEQVTVQIFVVICSIMDTRISDMFFISRIDKCFVSTWLLDRNSFQENCFGVIHVDDIIKGSHWLNGGNNKRGIWNKHGHLKCSCGYYDIIIFF